MKRLTLTTIPLSMLIIGSIDSIRNLPATALFGSSLLIYFFFSAILFLFPSALIAAELSGTCKENGGIFSWVRLAFGENVAFLSIWLQWVANVVWFPTILVFISGSIAYLINPELAQNKYFLITTTIAIFWLLTFINLRGVHFSAKITHISTIVGMLIPVVALILCAFIWIIKGNPSHLNFSSSFHYPELMNKDVLISLTAIMAGFVGIELTGVHINDVDNPQQTFPRALFFSVCIIVITMLLGSFAIAVITPMNQIKIVNGVMQTFTLFFNEYQISGLIPLLTILIILGSLGGVTNWIISPAKGLLQAGQIGFLPNFLKKMNRHNVASNLLITQAFIVSVISLMFLIIPSVNGAYWLLTALNTQIYMLMYVIMFAAGIVIRTKAFNKNKTFRIPGGKMGIWIVTLCGLTGCILTLIVGFIPPSQLKIGSHYQLILLSGILLSLLPALILFANKNLIFYKQPILYSAE